jgi:hypothetical protein
MVRISTHIGPVMTWKILTQDTRKILYQSQVRPALPSDRNLGAKIVGGAAEDALEPLSPPEPPPHDTKPPPRVTTRHDASTSDSLPTPIVNPHDLIGRTYVDWVDGEQHTFTITELIAAPKQDVSQCPEHLQFVRKCVDLSMADNIITYGQLMDSLAGSDGCLGV